MPGRQGAETGDETTLRKCPTGTSRRARHELGHGASAVAPAKMKLVDYQLLRQRSTATLPLAPTSLSLADQSATVRHYTTAPLRLTEQFIWSWGWLWLRAIQ